MFIFFASLHDFKCAVTSLLHSFKLTNSTTHGFSLLGPQFPPVTEAKLQNDIHESTESNVESICEMNMLFQCVKVLVSMFVRDVCSSGDLQETAQRTHISLLHFYSDSKSWLKKIPKYQDIELNFHRERF